MNNYTFLYRGGRSDRSPAEMQQVYEKWTRWFDHLKKQGALVNVGHPLEQNGSVVSGPTKVVSDGPFAEPKDVIGGYSIVTAPSLAAATEIAKGCPILEAGGRVEVRPIMPMGG